MALKNDYPIEALLRPPVELFSATVSLSAALIATLAPWALMMTPSTGLLTAICLGIFGYTRLRAGLEILAYHRSLKRLPHYALTADQMPVSNIRLFLGRGFAWGQKHTQRFRDTLRQEVQGYVALSDGYRLARKKEVEWEHTPLLRHLARAVGRDVWWNPWRPLPPVGGKPALHAVGWTEEQDVYMPLGERVGHTLVLGTTRVGKTRLAEILISQDIRRGDVVIVFDPKGDADLMRRMYAEAQRAGRGDEFYVFHLGYPELSSRYNAVGRFGKISEVATRVSRQLSGEGNSAAFKEFAWRFVNIVAQALNALGQRPDYGLILRYVTNIEPLFQDYCRHYLSSPELAAQLKRTQTPWDPQGWEARVIAIENGINDKNTPLNLRARQKRSIALLNFIKEYRIFDPVLDGLRSAVEYDKTYFDKITASLLPLLEKLTTGKVAELLAPDYFNLEDSRPIFDWMQVIRKKGIVYVGLDALTDSEVSTAVGNSMFADLVSVSGYIYKHGVEHGIPDAEYKMPTISLHADEFNELMGPEFIPLINKAGGSGVQVTAYTQTLSDIEARIGSKAKAGQVQGNFNTLIMLRVKELATAKFMTEQLPKVEINFLVQVSGVADSGTPFGGATFTSRNEDRISTQMVPLLEPSDLMSLPKGQAFALLEGGHLWKLRMPLPSKANDPHMPSSLQELSERMEEGYHSGDGWWGGASGVAGSAEWWGDNAMQAVAEPEADTWDDGDAHEETQGAYGALEDVRMGD